MNEWTDGCLVPAAASELKSSSGCLQQSSGAKMGCKWNVWTACKREGCTERALSRHPGLAECSASLPVVTVEPCAAVTASRYLLQMRSQKEQVEVSECITLHLHSSHSPTARVSFLILFTRFPPMISIHSPSSRSSLTASHAAPTRPHQPRVKWHFSPGASQCRRC